MKCTFAIIGGGPAGYFSAVTCAGAADGARVIIFEGSSAPLTKVAISGGGRCNVTHSCFDPRELIKNYPRGSKELVGPFSRFQPRDVMSWFEERGVQLKTEADGRVFPVSDSSSTIVECLESQRKELGIELRTQCRVKELRREEQGEFVVASDGTEERADFVLLATGSAGFGYTAAERLGHTVSPRVPALFTLKLDDRTLTSLSGVSVPDVELSIELNGKKFRQRGPLLLTHWGISGPAVIKFSSWCARELHDAGYKARLITNWLGGEQRADVQTMLRSMREEHATASMKNKRFSFPQRLWERFLAVEKIALERHWSTLSNKEIDGLASRLCREELRITGKGEFKEEFVTCGGVSLREVDFRTMESRVVPNLFFAGEVLDIDGVTGGFNFQSSWTTGWISGCEIARRIQVL